jgi:eukaryotic-like serine/threonine-protein kinase
VTNQEPDDELLSQLGRIADEFTDRVNRGEAPDLEEYLRRHAELSGVLRPVLQAVLALKSDRPTPVAEAAVPLRERPGTIIGSYKLLQQIGEGGMGVVFMAEQTHPVERKVALKVIKPGMDSEQVIARFEAERQALAMMDHVNIARVFDGGATEFGRPYFVMELVHGVPITKYCDDNHLTPRERLELFVPVCHAIQHAHQKGIIHRDVKPSNVMIALHDGRPVPKVIDFGVAKAIEQRLTERTLFTHFGTMVGTLEYMSPEQAETSAQGVDTRSDIFSLGVLLYELLTGSTPLSRKRVLEAGFGEILRMIKEEVPPKPSTRLSDSGETLASISAQRQMEPARLAKFLRGELDWIVMKTLEKDRSRRYETANAFAADVQRYLNDEPVQACPPSALYHFRKFARRNRAALGTAALLTAMLVVGSVVSTWMASRAARAERDAVAGWAEEYRQRQEFERQRDRALAAEKLARSNELKANRSATEARSVLEFFVERVLAAARPENQKGGLGIDASIRAAVDAAEPQVAVAFREQPLVEASIRNALGESYRFLGEPALAIRQHARARQLRSDQLGPSHPDTLTSMNNLALAYKDAGNFIEALPLYEETLEKRMAVLDPDHPDTLTSMNNLAMALRATGKYERALRLFEETLEKRKAKLDPDHPDTLLSMNNLANAYRADRKLDRAILLFEQTLEKRKAKLDPDHPDTLTTINDLASAYLDAGKSDQGMLLLEETLEKMKAKLGPTHHSTLSTMNNVAYGYYAAGKFGKALPLWEETLVKMKAKLGLDHPLTLTTMNNLGNAYRASGKHDRSVAILEETLEKWKAKFDSDHPDILIVTGSLTRAYQAAGKHDRALPLLEELLKRRKGKFGIDDPITLSSLNDLALAYRDTGRLVEAEAHLREAVAGTRRKFGLANPNTQTCIRSLSDCYSRSRQPEKAEPLWRELAEFWKEKGGADSPQYAAELHPLGQSLFEQQKPADAEPLLRKCLAIREKTQPDRWTTFNTKSLLGASLLSQKKYAEAEQLLVAGYSGLKQREATIPEQVLVRTTKSSLERLVQLYEATGQKDKTDEWRKKLEQPRDPPKP